MIRTLGRIVGGLIRLVVVVLVLSLLLSVALNAGLLVDGGIGADRPGTVETPEPLPDWPFVWEVPLEGGPAVDSEPRSDAVDDEDVGDPERDDPGTTTVERGESTVESDEIERLIHERVNEIRMDQDRSELEWDAGIASVARTYSHDMGEREYVGHVSPEGESPADRLDGFYPSECRAVGENIAVVDIRGTDADGIAGRIVDGWMDSDDHRENLLRGRWDREGVGVYLNDGRAFATQNFCDSR